MKLWTKLGAEIKSELKSPTLGPYTKKVQADCGQFIIAVLANADTNFEIAYTVGATAPHNEFTIDVQDFFDIGNRKTCAVRMDVTDD